jgi:ribosomal protein S12 methylthiotransferase accessory factor
LSILASNVEIMVDGPTLRLRSGRAELAFTFESFAASKVAGVWLQRGGAVEQLEDALGLNVAPAMRRALEAEGMLWSEAEAGRGSLVHAPRLKRTGPHPNAMRVLLVGLNDAGGELAVALAGHTLHVADFQRVHRGDLGRLYTRAELGKPRIKAFLDRVNDEAIQPLYGLAEVLTVAQRADLVILSVDHAAPKLMTALARAATGRFLVIEAHRAGGDVYLQPAGASTCVGCACAHRAARDPYVAAALGDEPEVAVLDWRHQPEAQQLEWVLDEVARLPEGGPSVAVDLRSRVRTTIQPHPRCRCSLGSTKHATDPNRPRLPLDALAGRLARHVDERWGTISQVLTHLRSNDERSIWRTRNVDPTKCEVAGCVAATAVAPAATTRESFVRGDGIARSPSDARALAMIECLERLATVVNPPAAAVDATPWTRLAAEALDPERLALFTPAQLAEPGFPYARFDRHTPLQWVWAERLVDRARRLLPRQLVGITDEPRILPQTSNGAAAHSNYTSAALHATRELIERDALLGCWLKQTALPRLADAEQLIESVPLAAALRRLGFRIGLLDATGDFGIPVLMATFEDSRNPDLFTLNAACADTACEALDKLCRELVLIWRSNLEEGFQMSSAPLPSEKVRSLDDHFAYHQTRLRSAGRKFLHASAEERQSTAMPWLAHGEPSEQLRALVQNLARLELDLFVVDCTPTWLRDELSIVKAIVPGLIPLYASLRERPLALARLAGNMPLNPAPHPFC